MIKGASTKNKTLAIQAATANEVQQETLIENRLQQRSCYMLASHNSLRKKNSNLTKGVLPIQRLFVRGKKIFCEAKDQHCTQNYTENTSRKQIIKSTKE